jgi:uncharacterized membrane protein YgcG
MCCDMVSIILPSNGFKRALYSEEEALAELEKHKNTICGVRGRRDGSESGGGDAVAAGGSGGGGSSGGGDGDAMVE